MPFVKHLTVVGSIVLDNTYLVQKFCVCVLLLDWAVIIAMEGIQILLYIVVAWVLGCHK